ncbi:MAG: S8 family serine peptidase, partial [Acidimicrobiales bacterium]
AIEALQGDGWLVVASAGNDASCRRTWPAALKDVVSVAAVGPHGPAWFSNFGPWVDACAPGVDIVSQYPKPDESLNALEGCEDLTAKDYDTGWATWSGTSFAAPVVAARLATHLIKFAGAGLSKEDAYDHALETVILNPALARIPSFGTIVNEA